MRLIPCRKIREGMELARDVVTGPPGTAPLLRTGVLLSERYATALPQAGIGSVWIEDDLGRDIDVVESLTPETRAKVHRATGDALHAARTSLKLGAGLPDAVVASLAEVADALVGDLPEIPEAALTLDDLSSFDAHTHRQSVQVAVLGLLLARRAWTKEGRTDYRGRQRYDLAEPRAARLPGVDRRSGGRLHGLRGGAGGHPAGAPERHRGARRAGEPLGALKLAGLVLAIGGVMVAVRRPGGGATGGSGSAAAAWALFAAAAFGTFLACVAPASEDGVFWAVLLSRVALLALFVSVALAISAPLRAPLARLPMLAVPGVLLFSWARSRTRPRRSRAT